MQLVENACSERIYPVGRLDRNTTGLLLFTNDGDLAKKLVHPKHGVRKIYHVTLDKKLAKHHFNAIESGLTLDDGPAPVDQLSYIDGSSHNQVGIELHIGRNRIVRRIFESLGYEVMHLDLSLIHISEPTRRTPISYAVFCLKKKSQIMISRHSMIKDVKRI